MTNNSGDNNSENRWYYFSMSGNIYDYLRYRKNEEALKNDNKGLSNKGTNSGGEGQISDSPYS